MNDQFNMKVKNSYKDSQKVSPSKQQKEQLTLPYLTSPASQNSSHIDVSERLRRLQSNLKMLEKQYRVNLKEGFDNKIKAYRLQAVAERRVLKQALVSAKKEKEKQHIRSIRINSQMNSLQNSRIQVMKADRQDRQLLRKRQLKQEKKEYSLLMRQKRLNSLQKARKSHDKVLEEAEHINVKKNYYINLREEQNKKKQQNLKHVLLQKIVSNTSKLKQLKIQLQNMKDSQIKVQKTFLTI